MTDPVAPPAHGDAPGPADEVVTVERHDQISVITLNRPEVHNALTLRMWGDIVEALASSPADTTCAIVRGAGTSFCAGGDLVELQQVFASPESVKNFRHLIGRTFDAISHSPFPVLASIDGAAMGGGAEIALACDMRIATARTRLSMPGARFGLALNAAEIDRVSRLVGPSRATYWLMTGNPIGATTAHEWGLVDEIVSDPFERAWELAQQITGNAAGVAAWTKSVLEGRDKEGCLDQVDAMLVETGLETPINADPRNPGGGT